MSDLRRGAIRIFITVALVMMAIDTCPSEWPGARKLKSWVSPVLNLLGLWQGEWPLFAPNPVINNAWLTAEFYEAQNENSGQFQTPIKTWNSPFWFKHGPGEKFYRFRHVNYFNRLPYSHLQKIEDFGDYITRKHFGTNYHPTLQVQDKGSVTNLSVDQKSNAIVLKLFGNRLNIAMPDDGTLPTREEIVWVSVGENLLIRAYQP